MAQKSQPQDQDLPPPYSQYPGNPVYQHTEPGPRFPQSGDEPLVHTPFNGQINALHGRRNGNALTSHLVSQLASVSQRIRDTREVRHAQQAQSDILLLDLIVPAIESFFADLGALDSVPPLATLTIVPSAAISSDAVLSGTEDMARRGEVSQVARIDTNRQSKANDSKRSDLPPSAQNGDSSSSWTTGREFDDGWGRWGEPDNSSESSQRSLWWRDEAMARRLAAYLQPPTPEPKPQPAVPVISTAVQEAVERQIPAEKQRKKGWGWGRRTSNRNSLTDDTSANASSASLAGGKAGTVAGGDVFGVSETSSAVVLNEPSDEMVVKAEEVAFRRENELGIWESMSGFGVVVTVKLQS